MSISAQVFLQSIYIYLQLWSKFQEMPVIRGNYMSCCSSSVTYQLTVLPASSRCLFHIPFPPPAQSLIIPTKKMSPNYILFLKLFEKQLPREPVIKCDNQTQHCYNVHFPLRSISLISNFKSLFKTSSKQVAVVDQRVSA